MEWGPGAWQGPVPETTSAPHLWPPCSLPLGLPQREVAGTGGQGWVNNKVARAASFPFSPGGA